MGTGHQENENIPIFIHGVTVMAVEELVTLWPLKEYSGIDIRGPFY